MARRIDPLQTAKPSKEKNMVIFEVNDKGREHEYSKRLSWDSDYSRLFVGFIESLGFEVKYKYEEIKDDIIIDDVSFHIDISNCSFMSRNRWTREKFERKPENRFISLTTGGDIDKIRVPINREVDADKIRDRINKAIVAIKKRRESYDAFEKKQKDDALTVARSFITKNVKKLVRQIVIDRGTISFYLHSNGVVRLGTDQTFTAIMPTLESSSLNDVIVHMKGRVTSAHDDLMDVTHDVWIRRKLADDLADFVNKTYHKYYNVESDSLTS